MRKPPIYVYINEYDWGMGATHYEDEPDALEAAKKRIFDSGESFVKTHKYELVES